MRCGQFAISVPSASQAGNSQAVPTERIDAIQRESTTLTRMARDANGTKVAAQAKTTMMTALSLTLAALFTASTRYLQQLIPRV